MTWTDHPNLCKAMAMDQPPITYLSFWDIELENLPAGVFRKRTLPTAEARGMVSAARASNTLICVSRKDIGAPYEARARERHDQLCQLLREHADIEIRLKDFFGDNCANASCLAEVTGQSRLLVVVCHYAFDLNQTSANSAHPEQSADARVERNLEGRLKMKLAPDSLQFHIFEQLSST